MLLKYHYNVDWHRNDIIDMNSLCVVWIWTLVWWVSRLSRLIMWVKKKYQNRVYLVISGEPWMWDYIVRKFLMDLIKSIKENILFYVCVCVLM